MEHKFKKEIGTLLGVLIVINSTIGTGIFKKSSNIVRFTGSIQASFWAWGLGAIIALCGALSLAELAASMPRSGGIYQYLRKTYHPSLGFLFGWTKLTLLIPSAVGSFAVLASEAIASTLGLAANPTRDTGFALTIIALCVGANLMGVKQGAFQQYFLTTLKYLGVGFIAIVGTLIAVSPARHLTAPSEIPSYATSVTFGGLCAAMVPVMWCYDGWDSLSYVAGEVKNTKVIPRALFLGTVAVAAIYLSANVGYVHTLGIDGLRMSTKDSNMVAANMAYLTLGSVGRVIISAIILTSCVGVCLSSLFCNSRIFVPMATDGNFFKAFGEVSDSGVPVKAILLSGVLGCFDVCFKSFDQLTDAAIIGGFPFYALCVVAVFILRAREPNMERPFKVPLYPIVPLVFLAGCAVFMVGACKGADTTAMLAFGVMLAGLPIYYIKTQWKHTSLKIAE